MVLWMQKKRARQKIGEQSKYSADINLNRCFNIKNLDSGLFFVFSKISGIIILSSSLNSVAHQASLLLWTSAAWRLPFQQL
jgi:hypothetical protein